MLASDLMLCEDLDLNTLRACGQARRARWHTTTVVWVGRPSWRGGCGSVCVCVCVWEGCAPVHAGDGLGDLGLPLGREGGDLGGGLRLGRGNSRGDERVNLDEVVRRELGVGRDGEGRDHEEGKLGEHGGGGGGVWESKSALACCLVWLVIQRRAQLFQDPRRTAFLEG